MIIKYLQTINWSCKWMLVINIRLHDRLSSDTLLREVFNFYKETTRWTKWSTDNVSQTIGQLCARDIRLYIPIIHFVNCDNILKLKFKLRLLHLPSVSVVTYNGVVILHFIIHLAVFDSAANLEII